MEDSHLMIGGAVAIGLVAITQVPNMQARQAESQQAGKQAIEIQQKNAKTAANKRVLEEQSQTAIARYKGHCEPIVSMEDQPKKPGTYKSVPIQDNEPIVAGAYSHLYNPAKPNPGYYLGQGIAVCDLHGKTAVMLFDPAKKYSVASDIAVTTDEPTIQAFRSKHKNIAASGFVVSK